MLREFVRRIICLDVIAKSRRRMQRDISALVATIADGSISVKCDHQTKRIPIFRKHQTTPFIVPSGESWMAGAVYDARPICFQGRRLFYFCGQPVYRSDMLLVVGLAEMTGDRLNIHPNPVIVPDIEKCGIDIPAFTVVGDEIIGIYADGHGPGANSRGVGFDVVIVKSRNGVSFTKHVIKAPFRDVAMDRIGLPWLLNDDGVIRVYMRAKATSRNYLVSSVLDLDNAALTPLKKLAEFPRNPINISVTKRSCGYLLFHGATTGGGFYVATSDDGLAWDFSQEMMLTSSDGEWGWDYYKVCGSPDNLQGDDVSMCYLSNNSKPRVGYGSFNVADLISRK
jgi:hypothetical protein